MIEVNQERFYEIMNRCNGQLFAHRNHCTWSTPSGREVGRTAPGYMPPVPAEPTRYFVYQEQAA